MSRHIVSWGVSAATSPRAPSPTPSLTPSVVSIDSILVNEYAESLETPTDSPELRPSPGNTPVKSLGGMTGSKAKPPALRPEEPAFARHEIYFFEDGTVTFLVDSVLYCVHRYFFARDSTYFSTRLARLGAREHEALATIISLGDVKRADFEAFLSILFPAKFNRRELSYEQWKGVLHLSTLWGFDSIRELALDSLVPPTPFDQLLLGRSYSVEHYIVPALSSLCERPEPLALDEMRHMSLEDVALVTTVRESIRACALELAVTNVPDIVKVAQAHLSNPRADSGALFKSLAASAQKGKRKQGKTSIRDVILQKAPQGSGGSGVSPHGPAGTGSAANGQPGRPAKVPDNPGHLAPLVPYGSSDTPVVAQGAEIPAERPLPAAAATEDTPADRQAPPLPPKGEPCAAQDSADASRTTETPVAQSVAESTWAAVDARADVSAGNVAYPFGFPSEGGAPMASGTSSVLPVDEALLAEAPESEDEWALPVKKLGVKKGKGKKK